MSPDKSNLPSLSNSFEKRKLEFMNKFKKPETMIDLIENIYIVWEEELFKEKTFYDEDVLMHITNAHH